MSFVIGRRGPGDGLPAADLGSYRAVDGSEGARLALDLNGPHAVLVVGKRGYGKSHTLGVLAEELARTAGLAPVVVDPMGSFDTLAAPARGPVERFPASVVDHPSVSPASLDGRAWCDLLGLSPERPAGALVWQAATAADTLEGMIDHVGETEAPTADVRAATNHLRLADSWGVFDTDGLSATDLATHEVTVLDLSGQAVAPMNAAVRAVAASLYRARVADTVDRFPWLLVDEAHTFYGGVAGQALRRILRRGRAPGVSLVTATQRPGAVPAVAVSQCDVVVSHRLTATEDLDALRQSRPGTLDTGLEDRMPTSPGGVVVLDDVTESIHAGTVRRRHTPHGGTTPSLE